jgi:hypothetical protein
LDTEVIEGLRADFFSSLERVFGYTGLSAMVVQDKLALNEPVDLVQTWDSDAALESACNNLIRGANNDAVNNVVPVFRFSMAQDLILYREWVCLRLARGLSVEDVKLQMVNWLVVKTERCSICLPTCLVCPWRLLDKDSRTKMA